MIRLKLAAVALAMAGLIVGPTSAAALPVALTAVATSAAPQRTQDRSGNATRRPRAEAAAPDPAKVKADAQAALTAAGNGCQVTDAMLLGKTGEDAMMYEAVCATGPGYLVVTNTPVELFDCVILASQAQIQPVEGAQTCSMPANQNLVEVMSEYARAAGVPCTVDEGLAAGRASNGATVYEVGCAGADGYWIEQGEAGWTKTPCIKIVADGSTCRFTTTAEQNATIQAMLANTPASGCVVDQYRLMGSNANGEYYETKCQVGSGRGYVVRVKDGVADGAYRCATARPIGGGCTLTPESEWTDPDDAE